MNADEYEWDFFLAHAGADLDVAEKLYDRLRKHARVFLDEHCIDPGDDWDQVLASAQKNSLISVVIVSGRTDDAYYQREEIAAAIQLARSKEKQHRVIPIFLDKDAARSDTLPYGLRLKQGLTLSDKLDLDGLELKLLAAWAKTSGQSYTPPVLDKAAPAGMRFYAKWVASGAALVAASFAAIWALKPTEPGVPIVAVPAKLASTSKPEVPCISIKHFAPNKIPHYLLNSVGSRSFPYWLKIEARNNCSDNQTVEVRFVPKNFAVLGDDDGVRKFTIEPDGSATQIFSPDVRLSLGGKTEKVAIEWILSINDDERFHTITADIVPEHTIAWDLKTPKGDAVPNEYLLASLGSWIYTPIEMIDDEAEKCRLTNSGEPLVGRERIRSCYMHLFGGDVPLVKVIPNTMEFPNRPTQTVSPMEKVLLDKSGTILEAALLFQALIKVDRKDGVDPRLIMLIAPEEAEQATKKSVSIVWKDNNEYHALNMKLANSSTFEENLEESRRAAQIFETNFELRNAVEKNGAPGAAFGDGDRIAAVDLQKATSKYKIKGLP